jgi:hypothetical protein
VCESLGVFLNDHASFDSVYTIKKLILDDNCIKDADFAKLLFGIFA